MFPLTQTQYERLTDEWTDQLTQAGVNLVIVENEVLSDDEINLLLFLHFTIGLSLPFISISEFESAVETHFPGLLSIYRKVLTQLQSKGLVYIDPNLTLIGLMKFDSKAYLQLSPKVALSFEDASLFGDQAGLLEQVVPPSPLATARQSPASPSAHSSVSDVVRDVPRSITALQAYSIFPSFTGKRSYHEPSGINYALSEAQIDRLNHMLQKLEEVLRAEEIRNLHHPAQAYEKTLQILETIDFQCCENIKNAFDVFKTEKKAYRKNCSSSLQRKRIDLNMQAMTHIIAKLIYDIPRPLPYDMEKIIVELSYLNEIFFRMPQSGTTYESRQILINELRLLNRYFKEPHFIHRELTKVFGGESLGKIDFLSAKNFLVELRTNFLRERIIKISEHISVEEAPSVDAKRFRFGT